MRTQITCSLLIILLVTGCFDLANFKRWESGSYSIENSSSEPCLDLFLNFEEGSIGRVNCISKIGENTEFIIAESKTNDTLSYWLIEKLKDHKYLNKSEAVIGPMSKEQFKSLKAALAIEDLDFQKEFKE